MNKPGRNSKRRHPKKRRLILRGVLFAAIGFYLVWVIFNYVSDTLKAKLVETQVANYDYIQSTVDFNGILVRDETVLSVPNHGKLAIVASEGERVRVGAVVFKVNIPDVRGRDGVTAINISSPRAGLVSYRLDGLEKLLVPHNVNIMDLFGIFAGHTLQSLKYDDNQVVEAGQTVAKVVNNLEPMLVLGELPNQPVFLKKIKPGGRVLVDLGLAGSKPVYLTVVEAKPTGDKLRIVLELNDFAKEFIQNRVHTFRLISDRFEGYIVPEQALVYKDNKPGIYTVYKKLTRWQPVKIEGKVKDQVAVSGLEPETTYVINPKYIEEGQPVN
ncbi:HlyD family efflux transporter periplasmic adaptor subunit [Thermincola potens]|uniref:RND related barrel-sandwich hybrid domain-containing protein n=1 Tax=Thermincola potens (strain JR) TaxID=635013 RepID=D5X966_THEPJ|nr:HlyD family efflux transporter periplasmic adaptor subunit [Thermincola potens]ADG82970.1 hypothetical protein TherJR_2125 [Thermincola potens JR]